jgi:PKD repeat protein
MNRIYVTLFLFFIGAQALSAQSIDKNHSVNSVSNEITYQSRNIYTYQLPKVDVEKLRNEDAVLDQQKDIPWRFGKNIDVNINMTSVAVPVIIPDKGTSWCIKVVSAGATSLNFTFDKYLVPPGAQLFIYNQDRSIKMGPYTCRENKDDYTFATTLFPGSEAILEYVEPFDVTFPGELHISVITHGYRGFNEFTKAFGDAGSCQLNASCPEGAGWENQIKSICMIVVGGNGICTGTLINNTSNDGTPYVLTANHCTMGTTISTWVFWFNWQSSTCTNPISFPGFNAITGASLKAKYTSSDFCLVQMNSKPPSSYDVYYSGWNRTNVLPDSGMAIHHPSGDIKKVSPCSAMTVATYSGIACWKAPWLKGTCTESGSSGCPLFDQNKRIIGQLSGGPSSCGGSSMWDFFGRFRVSWTGNATNTTRLSNWLDPITSGDSLLDGYKPSIAVKPTIAFAAQVTNSCNGKVCFYDQSDFAPTSWYWDFGDGNTSALQNPIHEYLINGTYSVKLKASNAFGTDSLTKTNYIVIAKPTAPTASGDTVCSLSTAALTASGSGIVNWYDSSTGHNLLYSGHTFITPILNNTTQYYLEDSISGALSNTGKVDSVGGGSFYNYADIQYLTFNALSPFILKSVKIYADTAQSNKTISLWDAQGNLAQSIAINLVSGINTVALNFFIPAGNAWKLVGPPNPGWYRNTAGFTYPITISGILSITGSSASPTLRYFYFYDWQIQVPDCISQRTSVEAYVETCSGNNEIPEDDNLIITNPVTEEIIIKNINAENNIQCVVLYDMQGKIIISGRFEIINESIVIPVSELSKGIYNLRISTKGFSKSVKIQKI